MNMLGSSHSWQSVGLIILATMVICLFWIIVKYLLTSRAKMRMAINDSVSVQRRPSARRWWLTGVIIVLLVYIIPHLAKNLGYEFSKPSAVTAKPVVYRPPIKPVYVCQRAEHFTIIALPGDPKDPNAWAQADELVIPDHCDYEVTTRGKVWWRDQFGYIREDGPDNQSAGYTRSNNRHVWFVSQEGKKVVVDVKFSPTSH